MKRYIKSGIVLSVAPDVRAKLEATPVREYYLNEYPMDPLGEEIADATFADVLDALNGGKNVYDVIGVGDSVVREGVFTGLSKLLNAPYRDVYNLWLKR